MADNGYVLTVAHTEWRRVIGCLIFIRPFSQKSPIISGSFAKYDLQLKASYGSSPPCTGCVCDFVGCKGESVFLIMGMCLLWMIMGMCYDAM